jgi:hypothetical protein
MYTGVRFASTVELSVALEEETFVGGSVTTVGADTGCVVTNVRISP